MLEKQKIVPADSAERQVQEEAKDEREQMKKEAEDEVIARPTTAFRPAIRRARSPVGGVGSSKRRK